MKLLSSKSFLQLISAITFLGIGILGYIYLKEDFIYSLFLLPILLTGIYMAVFHTEKLFLVTIFLTPLSVTLKDLGLAEGHQSLDLSLPTEPIFAGILLLGIIHQIHFDFIHSKFKNHLITKVIIIQIAWILFTSLTSSMPLVSVKFLVARLWFVGSAYFFASYLFKNKKNVFSFLSLYLAGLTIVVLVTTFKHAELQFSSDVSNWIMSPFYNDHTAYGAAISLFIPISVGLFLIQKKSFIVKTLLFAVLVVLFIGLYLSSARAAWLSVAAGVGVFITLLLKIKFRTLFISILAASLIFFTFQDQLIIMLGKNKADSEGNKADNIASMTNIKTDPSNLERINRWNCALRMFNEKPLVGFGPGTYILQYAPFQKSSERTIISNNDGSNGNAHSEYLGPLAEQGLIGMLIVLTLFLSVFFTAYRLFYSLQEKKFKIIVASIIVGLTTYFVHGILNNFLDTDKLAIPFWGMISILVSIDVFHHQKQDKAEEK